ncbi:MAG: Y-family DNA polymerase [Deltaproteobacteria bacterium]|jgi:DNA polymerase V|nr:Y-family DNA polymerase [Deltaproteobacteria bacterium]
MSLPLKEEKPKFWALADCVSFYCACERLFRPDLAHKPLVVLSNNDGCVVSLTPEAKDLGFKRGDLFFKIREKLLEAGAAVFSSNYALYGDISRRVALAMESVAPKIYQYSIDEAFIPLPEALAAQALEVGYSLKERVARWVGVPVRVGLGPTRTIAKLANRWAKKLGPVVSLELGQTLLEELLGQTELEDIWGIGRGIAKKLVAQGLKTAADLRNWDIIKAKKLVGVTLERVILELRGYQCIDMDLTPSDRKSLVSSHSFGHKITNFEALAEALTLRCSIAGAKLRREKLKASALSIFIETGSFAENPFQGGATVTFSRAVSSTLELVKAARIALQRAYQPNRPYAKAGVALFDLSPEDTTTSPSLFSGPNDSRAQDLMRAMDRICDRHGQGAIKISTQGLDPNPAWAARRERLSPVSTTCWSELPTVKV